MVDRAVQILDALSAAPNGLLLSELTSVVRVNRTTAARIIGNLIGHRMVVRDPDLRYRLGLRLFELGSSVKDHHLAFHGAAIGSMRRAAESFGLTGFLAIRDGDRALFVEQAVYGEVAHVYYPVGTSLPLNTGAASHVLLAYAGESEIERLLSRRLEKLTSMTITDPEALLRELSRVRATGVATSDSDVMLGLGAIGAPVRNSRGSVIAAVSLAGESHRLFSAEQQLITDAVVDLAAHISAELGWHGPAESMTTVPGDRGFPSGPGTVGWGP